MLFRLVHLGFVYLDWYLEQPFQWKHFIGCWKISTNGKTKGTMWQSIEQLHWKLYLHFVETTLTSGK